MKVRNGFDGNGIVEHTKVEQFEEDKVVIQEEIGNKNVPFDIFKNDFVEFLETSTIHGFARISSASSWISRIVWIIIVLLLIVYLGESVYNLHMRLVSKEINVIVKSRKVNALTLPAITVCDGHPYLKSGDDNKNDTNVKTALQADKEHMERMLDKNNIHNKTMSNFILKDVNGDMPLCQFSGDQCVFTKHITGRLPLLHKGQCYTFNQDGSYKQILQGPTMGVFAVFYLANDTNVNKSTSASSSHGVEVFIHKPKGKITTAAGGILGIPGHLTRVNVRQKIYKRLPTPYPDECVDGDDMKESLHECQIKCIAMHQIKQCQVISITIKYYLKDIDPDGLGNITSAPTTKTPEEYACVKNVIEEYANEKLRCDCHLPCFEKVFDVSISQSKWPHDDSKEELLALIKSEFGITISTQESHEQLAAIQVYYGQLQYDEILQQPAYSVDKFLSDLGGLLGLFIGASVFSGIDFILFIMWTIKSQLRLLIDKIRPPRLNK